MIFLITKSKMLATHSECNRYRERLRKKIPSKHAVGEKFCVVLSCVFTDMYINNRSKPSNEEKIDCHNEKIVQLLLRVTDNLTNPG